VSGRGNSRLALLKASVNGRTGMQPSITVKGLWSEYRRDKLTAELRGDWAVAVFYRLPSMVLIVPLVRLGVAPVAVTVAALAVALAMLPAAFLASVPLAGTTVVCLAFAFQVLDCVDGGLARATGGTSVRGATFDFLVDMVQWGVLYASIGILADRAGDGSAFWSSIGLAAGWSRLFARVVRDAGERAETRAPVPAVEAKQEQVTFTGLILAFLAGLSGLIPVLLAFALATGHLAVLTLFLLVYGLADIAEGLTGVLAKGRDSGPR
jgi:phosphatidylglycerophosphate synthase